MVGRGGAMARIALRGMRKMSTEAAKESKVAFNILNLLRRTNDFHPCSRRFSLFGHTTVMETGWVGGNSQGNVSNSRCGESVRVSQVMCPSAWRQQGTRSMT